MIQHPIYRTEYSDFPKWRLAFRGGTQFKEKFLKSFSSHESDDDFALRKATSYSPSFAKAAINEVIGGIVSRLKDVVRLGPKQYQEFISNVDGHETSLDTFIANKVLPEFLVMRKVAVCVDREPITPNMSFADAKERRVYLYTYNAESIISWRYDRTRLVDIFLAHSTYTENQFGLLEEEKIEYKRYYISTEGNVIIQYYDGNSFQNVVRTITTTLSQIPIVIFEISESLMSDIADYQIALMNMESSDVSYIIRSNIPFYTEQYDPKAQNTFIDDADDAAADKDVVVGAIKGRRYPVGVERPGYVHPSSEPIKASMEKQAKIKEDIRLLLNLTIANLRPSKNTSAESKDFDQGTLENGLSVIGSVLETGEKIIAKLFADYTATAPAIIRYPTNYTLKTDEERRVEAEKLIQISKDVQSLTYKKEILKRIVALTLGFSIATEKLRKIYAEIDAAQTLNTVESIEKHVELGLVDKGYAASLLNYPEGSAEKANKEHAERLAIINAAQAPTSDQNVEPQQDKLAKEKQNSGD